MLEDAAPALAAESAKARFASFRPAASTVRDDAAGAPGFRYSHGVNPRAILALAGGVPAAIVGLMAALLFDGVWFSSTAVSSITWYALMRPATAARARLTPSFRSTHG